MELGKQGVVDGAAEHDEQRGAEDEHSRVVHQAGRTARPLAEADGHVVVERPGGVHAARVLRDDPPEPEHAGRRPDGLSHRVDEPKLSSGAQPLVWSLLRHACSFGE